MNRSWPDPPATLPDALQRAAAHFPERGVVVFDGRGRSHERRTYPQILASARQAAGRWAALGVEPGDAVAISLPTSWVWFEAWLGALLRGALPVAIAPGAAMGAAEAQVRKVAGLLEHLGVRRAVVTRAIHQQAERSAAQSILDAALLPEAFLGVAPATVSAPQSDPDDIAFLQLTSGSTGLPRAVMIPHRAAVHNPLASDVAIGVPHGAAIHDWIETVVSWLPLHHDMGLVGCFFLSLLCGFELRLLQPQTFLARPRHWLEQLGSHPSSLAPAPNFGYQLCVERLAKSDRQGLDLSSWRSAMTGAEMIRPETVAGFCAAFEPHGFDPRVLRPCYGLAEGTLAVTFDLRGEGARLRPMPSGAGNGLGLSEVVSVGAPVIDTEMRIVAPSGDVLPDGEVGEVRVKGPGVFAGYYNDPEATAEGLQDGWLLTGDLGFMHDGELHLTGRVKDLLILRGHNLMPHELEWAAESVTGGGGAIRTGAFSVARGAQGEEAVVVVEVNDRQPELLAQLGQEIRHRVGRVLSLPLADVVFVRRGKIPKTTSGKVQRRALRDLYLDGELERLDTDRDA